MATRMMTRACAESSRQPHAADASIDVCTGPHDDGEDHGPRDARLAFLAGVATALLAPAARVLVGRGVRSFADPQAPGRLAHGVACAVAQAVLRRLVLNAFLDYFDNSTPSKHPVFGCCRRLISTRRASYRSHAGKVVDGMDVVSAIEGVPTDGRDKPIDAVRVESITIAE